MINERIQTSISDSARNVFHGSIEGIAAVSYINAFVPQNIVHIHITFHNGDAFARTQPDDSNSISLCMD